MKYSQHALSAAFPGMNEEEFTGLCEDMRTRGQRDEITIYDGQILDGWHRYRACQILGLPPRTKHLGFGVDPLGFVLSGNLHRRSLSATQRAEAVVACSKWAESGDNQHTMKTGGDLGAPPQTVKEMAGLAAVSERTIQRTKAAHEAGLGKELRDGKLSAKKAAEIIHPRHPKAPPESADPRTIEIKAEPEPSKEETVTVPKAVYEEMQTLVEEAHAESQALEKMIDAADDEKLTAAVSEIKVLTAQVTALKADLTGKQNKENELIRIIKSLRRQIANLEKELNKDVVKTKGGMPI